MKLRECPHYYLQPAVDTNPVAEVILKDIDDTMKTYESKEPDYYNECILLRPVRAYGVCHKPKPTSNPQPAQTK